jgi:hypothetical protein
MQETLIRQQLFSPWNKSVQNARSHSNNSNHTVKYNEVVGMKKICNDGCLTNSIHGKSGKQFPSEGRSIPGIKGFRPRKQRWLDNEKPKPNMFSSHGFHPGAAGVMTLSNAFTECSDLPWAKNICPLPRTHQVVQAI